MKEHVVEYFSGEKLSHGYRWNLQDINGGTTGAMADEVDGGYKVSFSTQQYAWGGLTYDNVRQFDLESLDCIVTVKRTFGSSNGGYWAGVSGVKNTNQNNTAALGSNTGQEDNFYLFLKGTTTSRTESDVTIDDNWHTGKIESRASSVKLLLDGVLKVTVGSGMGDYNVQPSITAIDNSTDSGNSFSIRYFEAYNI